MMHLEEENFKEIETKMGSLNSELKSLDGSFKKKYAFFLNFKDNTDSADGLERTLEGL